jgi:hypothetical protein
METKEFCDYKTFFEDKNGDVAKPERNCTRLVRASISCARVLRCVRRRKGSANEQLNSGYTLPFEPESGSA